MTSHQTEVSPALTFFDIRHGQPASHHQSERHQRRATVLHQQTAAHAGRGEAERSAQHPRVHPAGQGPGHRPQPPLLPSQGQK